MKWSYWTSLYIGTHCVARGLCPLTLAAYVADIPKRAYVEPVGVADCLPDMPAYLDQESYVPVPLEATYQATWASCPEDMREVIERGEPLSDESSE